ncbi:hypothetical protein HMPREF1327_00319, partial [Enterococcus faecalis 599]
GASIIAQLVCAKMGVSPSGLGVVEGDHPHFVMTLLTRSDRSS